MTVTFQRSRIEVLVDKPIVQTVVAASKAAGIKAYTLLPTIGGERLHGVWSEDQLTGAQQKQVFLAVTRSETATRFVELLEPYLDSHGLILLISTVEVVRGAKF